MTKTIAVGAKQLEEKWFGGAKQLGCEGGGGMTEAKNRSETTVCVCVCVEGRAVEGPLWGIDLGAKHLITSSAETTLG